MQTFKKKFKPVLFILLVSLVLIPNTQCCQSEPITQNETKANAAHPSLLRPAIDPLKPGGARGLDILNSGKQVILIPLSEIAEKAIQLQASPAQSKLKGLELLRIKVKNNTDRPVIFQADQSTATIGDTKLIAAANSVIEDQIPMKDNPKGYGLRSLEATISAALTVGAVQAISDQSIERGEMQARYGWDNARRQNLQARFSKRVLWPGDSSEGIVYFKTKQALKAALFELPISAFYDQNDHASVKFQIQ